MMAYGWTLDEAMELTFPRVMCLMEAIGKYPPVDLLASELLKSLTAKNSKKADGQIESALSGVTGAGGKVKKVTPGDIGRRLKGIVGA